MHTRIKWQFSRHFHWKPFQVCIVNGNHGIFPSRRRSTHFALNFNREKSSMLETDMKVKKRFCAPINLVKGSKKSRLPSGIALIMRPIQQLRFSDNVTFLQQATPKFDDQSSFHRAIYPVMFIAQCFGVMPVINISSKSPMDLVFTWKSFRLVFALIVMISCGFEAVSTIAWTFRTRIEFGKMVILVYYITNFLSFYCFLRLARAWPELMMRWHEVEKKLQRIETVSEKHEMTVRIRRTAFVILTLSAIEHILSIVSSVAIVLDCPKIKNIMEAYYVHNFPQVFSFVKYSHMIGGYVKFIHITSTFVWSYADLFIMMISCGLSAKLKQINARMLEDKGKVRLIRRKNA